MNDRDSRGALEIVRLAEAHVAGLHDLFASLEAGNEAGFFQPHPTDRAHLGALARRPGLDLYYVATLADRIVAYGLLRGWDEGFAVPSLGIAIAPECRGMRLGDMLMSFLHAAARLRGARRVRLRVVHTNRTAIRLYERTGYRFDSATEVDAAGQPLLVAYKDLVN